MKLCLIIRDLPMGGMERVLAVLAEKWVADGHDVFVLTFSLDKEDFYELSPGVKRVRLELDQAKFDAPVLSKIIAIFRVVMGLRVAIKQCAPDVVIGFSHYVNILVCLAAVATGYQVVATEHTNFLKRPLAWWWRLLRRATYPLASRVVVLTADLASELMRWRPSVRAVVIPNPLPPTLLALPLCGHHSERKSMVALGRLIPEKGYDILIRAFAEAVTTAPEWRLWIIGEGEERKNLETLICHLGLRDKVFLPGATRNPWRDICEHDLFVFPSRVEGFGMALAEAMALGLPCIAFSCPSGPQEITSQGEDALLVPAENEAALAAAMSMFMRDRKLREYYAGRAINVRHRYSVEEISRLWQLLFDELVADAISEG